MLLEIYKFFILNIFLIIFFYNYYKNIIKYSIFNIKKNNYNFINKSFYIQYFNINQNNYDYFKITYFKYSLSYKYKIIKVEYNIGLYDKNKNLICPSDIKLYSNLTILCNIRTINNNLNIESLANINKNRYYQCIEFFSINEKANLGIKIYEYNENTNNNSNYYKILFFTEEIGKYNNIYYLNDKIFDPLLVHKKYNLFVENLNDKKINETLKLKNSFILYPLYNLKRYAVLNENEWKFLNIYNHYFCYCKGENCLFKISQKCKYNLYLSIIDNNRDLYLKTDYLFIDFIFTELSSDDVYPVFKEMEKQRLPVHYITEKIDIYEEYCGKTKNCLTIIPVTKDNYYNNGDFLEKYLSLFLKLKAVISNKYTSLHSISILFYNIEYITYISVGHGVCYFKGFLFNDYRLYGRKKNNKILIPPSDILISIAKKYGWKDKDIIKINLPRWDKYNSFNDKHINNINYIFLMFTWRDIKNNKKISSYYIRNITNLLKNDLLNEIMKKKKIILYFSLHRYNTYKYYDKYIKILEKNKFMKYIEQNEISECLSKVSLVVTDFSSIIFDLMYRYKPYVIYVPDADDPEIKNIYTEEYYQLIESIKNDTIKFENKFFNINQTVEKIVYYINNNFKIDPKLKFFYDSFGLKKENNIKNFIIYLKNVI